MSLCELVPLYAMLHRKESTICKHDGTPKGFSSSPELSQKWFTNGQVLSQKVLIYHKNTRNPQLHRVVDRIKYLLMRKKLEDFLNSTGQVFSNSDINPSPNSHPKT